MDAYLHAEDAEIITDDQGNQILTRAEDGAVYFRFPAGFSKSQVVAVLKFANEAFRAGIELGEKRTQHAIRAALGIQ